MLQQNNGNKCNFTSSLNQKSSKAHLG